MLIVRETHFPDYLHHFNVYIPYHDTEFINIYTCMCCDEMFIHHCNKIDEPDTNVGINEISIHCLKHWFEWFKRKYKEYKNKPWYKLIYNELENAIKTHSKSDKFKFAEGEKVYIVKDGVIYKAEVRIIYYDGTNILYNCKANKIVSRYLDYKSHIAIIPENEVFKTKEQAEQYIAKLTEDEK